MGLFTRILARVQGIESSEPTIEVVDCGIEEVDESEVNDLIEQTVRRRRRHPSGDPTVAAERAIRKRVAARQIDELVGICRGVIFDGGVTDGEAKNLLDWMTTNAECAHQWPYNVLYSRIVDALSDGKITEEEEHELLIVLQKVTKAEATVAADGALQGGSTGGLPFDEPAPEIVFPERRFCVTGEFAYGSRAAVTDVIKERGGRVTGSVSNQTDYLVVGITGSEAWLHSTHGTKIVKAVEVKQCGGSVAIVSEEHWTRSLGG